MHLTTEQVEYLKDGFEEDLYHWCHPFGDEPCSYLGCTQKEYDEAAQTYYYDALKDSKELTEDWETCWKATEEGFREEFGVEIHHTVYMPIFMDCLKDHLII